MGWLSEKIDNVLTWIADLITSIFLAVIEFFKDIFVWVFDSILSAFASLVEAIPAPSFLANGLDGLFSALPASVIYLMSATGFFQGLAIIGAGVAFNLVRKAVTLGQW